jgi:hypothetical protein
MEPLCASSSVIPMTCRPSGCANRFWQTVGRTVQTFEPTRKRRRASNTAFLRGSVGTSARPASRLYENAPARRECRNPLAHPVRPRLPHIDRRTALNMTGSFVATRKTPGFDHAPIRDIMRPYLHGIPWDGAKFAAWFLERQWPELSINAVFLPRRLDRANLPYRLISGVIV